MPIIFFILQVSIKYGFFNVKNYLGWQQSFGFGHDSTCSHPDDAITQTLRGRVECDQVVELIGQPIGVDGGLMEKEDFNKLYNLNIETLINYM